MTDDDPTGPDPETLPDDTGGADRVHARLFEAPVWSVDEPDDGHPEPEPVGPPVTPTGSGDRGPNLWDPGQAEPAAPPPLLRIIEAMLFLGGPPLTEARAAEAVRGLSPGQLPLLVEELNRAYRSQGRPYHVLSHDGGFRMALRPRFQPVHDRIFGTVREARLSPAAVDVLALVAYRQPVTRAEIDSLRGSDSAKLVHLLVRHGLVAVTRRDAGETADVAYVTTARFLDMFGLSGLDDLPRTFDVQQI